MVTILAQIAHIFGVFFKQCHFDGDSVFLGNFSQKLGDFFLKPSGHPAFGIPCYEPQAKKFFAFDVAKVAVRDPGTNTIKQIVL